MLFWGFLGFGLLRLFRFRSKWSTARDRRTDGTAVAMVTRSPGARQRGVLMTPAKYEVDRSTGGEVMGIFCKLRN